MFQKQDKKVDDSITLVFTYHPELNQLYEILRRAQKNYLKSLRLVRSTWKEFIYKDAGTNVCVHSTVMYVKYLKLEISLKVRLPRKNFPFECNICYVVYLMTC